jgi:hypothetical protein
VGDVGDYWRDAKNYRQKMRLKYGIDCPECNIKEPKRIPTILMPGQKCRVCGYRDKRKRRRG